MELYNNIVICSGTTYFNLCRMPMTLEHLLAVLYMRFFQVNCESIVSPRKLKWSTLSIAVCLICSIGSTVFLFVFLYIINLDFCIFRDSLFI